MEKAYVIIFKGHEEPAQLMKGSHLLVYACETAVFQKLRRGPAVLHTKLKSKHMF